MANITNKDYISLKEAAQLTGYHPDYIGYLIRKGKIRGEKAYGSSAWLIHKEDILNYKGRQHKRKKQKREILKAGRDFKPSPVKPSPVKPSPVKPSPVKPSPVKPSPVKSSLKKQSPRKLISDILPPERIRKIAKEEILGIKTYKSPKIKYLNIASRLLIGVAILFLIISSFTGFPFEAVGERGLKLGEQKVDFYSFNCVSELGWENSKNAQGPPDTFSDNTINAFSEQNSAVYKGGHGSITCNKFQEVSPEKEEGVIKDLQSAKIYLSFALDEQGTERLLLEPEESQQRLSLWQKLLSFIARAQEGAPPRKPKDVNEDTLDTKIIVRYSLDGETWVTFDKISTLPLSNKINGGYLNYEAPFITDWEKIEDFKISFEGAVGGEANIIAFLDSVWVKVEYTEEKISFKKIKEDFDGSDNEIFFTLEKELIQVTDNTIEDRNPQTDGRYVVWEADIDGRWQIFLAREPRGWEKITNLYSASPLKVIQITDTDYANTDPQISDGKIVWQAWVNDSWNIFLYDSESSKTVQLTHSKYPQMFPKINKNRVVWQGKDKNNHWQIFLAKIEDLPDYEIIQVTQDKSENEAPEFEENQIKWRKWQDNQQKEEKVNLNQF